MSAPNLFWNPDEGKRGGAWIVTMRTSSGYRRHVVKGVSETDTEGAVREAARILTAPEPLTDPLAQLQASIDAITETNRSES